MGAPGLGLVAGARVPPFTRYISPEPESHVWKFTLSLLASIPGMCRSLN